MGRRKLDPSEKRTIRREVKLTPDEAARLDAAAAEAGVNLARWMRETILASVDPK